MTVISLIGPAGSGKTSLDRSIAVPAGSEDSRCGDRRQLRCRPAGCAHRLPRIQAVPLVTDNLTADLSAVCSDTLDVKKLDLLLIEADVNAIDPAEFDFGQHLRVSVFSVAGGDDRATEYPFLVAGSDLILLTKTDLLPFVTFDIQVFRQDVKRLKPKMKIIHSSTQSSQGINSWVGWVESQLVRKPDSKERRNFQSHRKHGRLDKITGDLP